MKVDTLIVKGIEAKHNPNGSVVPPIVLASTFVQDGIEEFQDYAYSRGANPTRNAFEELFAKFEGAKHCFALASGMAATSTVFNLLKSGDRVLLNNNVYGGTFRYVSGIFKNQGINYELVDDLNKLKESDISSDVKMIFIETPSNPLLRVTDIKKITELAHKKGILVVVDNTFLTPYYQKLFSFGVDIVVYSATKYIGGHADLIAGIVTTNDDVLAERIKFMKNTLGATLAPTDAYYLIRGLKTLSVRFDRQSENTLKIIKFLKDNEAIEVVHYAGSHSTYEKQVQQAQASGVGAVISIELKAEYDYKVFAKSLKLFDLAVSLGGVESLICHPASMTHEAYPRELQDRIGIKQNLLRLAIGIENVDDLIADLSQAIAKAKK
ncbi:PLP-dependent transferase [Campylobacter sp. faydin G-140]|uniref:trans-sulfuration enzyme family protein n=1 Tax=Campylobacter anatolicus TaxID=2829105 RepID=UPI001B96F69F|nr:PLP-dependent aspartate aminotransferase family protein [Campylobacter anatolicus]MBR8461545.1 PLP-dependent transferase [Campylobacter anatolicus]MBR8466077.1 PLP-dependent transferase [Campylobacter anatolicus]